MARGAIIDISLTAKELKLVRERVKTGGFGSESDVIREGLRQLFRQADTKSKRVGRSESERLEAAYRATSVQDRQLACEWSGALMTHGQTVKTNHPSSSRGNLARQLRSNRRR